MKKVIKKLKRNSGFTLAETLMTVLILVMVSGVMAGGIPSAVTAYSKAVDAANAQVALSTTVNALRSELSTAWDVHSGTDNSIIYISSDTGSKTKIYQGTDPGDTENSSDTFLMVQDYLGYDETTVQADNKPHRLVSKAAVTSALHVAYETVTYENDVVTFSNLTVTKGGAELAKVDNLYIHVLSADFRMPDVLSS